MVPMTTPVDALLDAARSGLVPERTAVLLAVSGGADSLALLHASVEAARPTGWRLAVGHVHHGWRARSRQADRDLEFVRGQARRAGLPFLFRRADARGESERLGISPEAGARAVRYAALAEMKIEAGASLVATAHQADDVLESYLLARDRAGGVASLGGPRARRDDGVVRPLLSVSRAEIESYLESLGPAGAWRRDSTNGDLRLSRNAVRRRIAGASEIERRTWAREAAEHRARRDRLDRELEARLRPALRSAPGSVLVDDDALRDMGLRDPDLLRAAVEEAAKPFARPGRPPMTGRERERLLAFLFDEGDFSFEAGRRVAVRRRGRVVAFSARGV
jgi:tRNA(Ile)-lysidine synthetase-like protein